MKNKIIKTVLIATILSLPIYGYSFRGNPYEDIPTWSIGDKWVYEATIYYSSPNGSFNGNIHNFSYEVAGINIFASYDAYVLNLSGEIEGTFTSSIISGDINGYIWGNSWVRRADLSNIHTTVWSNGTIHYLIFDYPYFSHIEIDFLPSAEYFDFPLYLNESWQYSYTLFIHGYINIEGITNETINETIHKNGYLTCSTLENINVPAGEFMTYRIDDVNSTTWYSPSVKNIVKSIANSSGNNTYTFSTDLTGYILHSQPMDISFNINPNPAYIGESGEIYGNVSFNGNQVSNCSIEIKIPGANVSYYTLTNQSGEFYLEFEIPSFQDNTPAPNELASDGVIVSASLNDISSYAVKTLVIKQAFCLFHFLHGWNFITLPFHSNYTASMLCSAIPNCSMILAWNASLQDFIAYAPGSPNDFPIEDGHGYFIAINNGSMFNITGMPIESVNITLLSGWNALGWFKDEPTTARSILENITSCNTVLTWNATMQDFVVYINGSPYNPVIHKGDGFFVSINRN